MTCDKLGWLLFFLLLGIMLIIEYNRILDDYKDFGKLSRIPKASNLTLQTTTAAPEFSKNVYIKFQGRLGNVIFEFAAAYSMTLAAGCKKIFIQDNRGQSKRFQMLFPTTKNLINMVGSLPKRLKTIKGLNYNKYSSKTTRAVARSKTDVFLDGFFGKFLCK